MKNLLIILFAVAVAAGCGDSTRVYQKLEDINIAVDCPCELKVDSNTIDFFMYTDSLDMYAYLCYDSTYNDAYKITVLPYRDTMYTTSEFIEGFSRDMDTSNVIARYEVINIDGDTALVMKHKDRSRIDMQLFGKEASMYFIVRAEESLEEKFNKFIGSIVNIKGYHNNGAI